MSDVIDEIEFSYLGKKLLYLIPAQMIVIASGFDDELADTLCDEWAVFDVLIDFLA